MKRMLLVGSFVILFMQAVLPSATFAVKPTSFSDVKDTYWATPVITQLVEKGYMEGYEDGTFKPNNYTTRAEAAAVIARTMEIPLDSTFIPAFTDITTTHPYYKEICKLAELGIIQNAEWFNPEEPLKRAHISKMIALAYEIEVDQKNKVAFKDLPKTYWAKHYIESLADTGVIKGKTATLFEPNSYVTRAHVAALTVRGMEFQQQVQDLQVAYDYLAKSYISTVREYKKVEQEVIELVNAIRVKNQLSPLLQDRHLTQLAIIKAQDMLQRNYFEHYSPYYGNPWDMATLFDYAYTSYGENIARHFKTAAETVNAWMASPKHRDNMLKASYTHIGVGIKKGKNGKFYLVQHFSSK